MSVLAEERQPNGIGVSAIDEVLLCPSANNGKDGEATTFPWSTSRHGIPLAKPCHTNG